MASKKTLALLEIAEGLVKFFAALAEEETAAERKKLAAAEPATPEPTIETTSTAEEVPQMFVAAENTAVHETLQSDSLTSEPTERIQVPPATAQKQPIVSQERPKLEMQTQEVISKGDFREMTDFRKRLNVLGFKDLAQLVTNELTRRNREQAQTLIDDRDQTFRSLLQAISDKDMSAAKNACNALRKIAYRIESLNPYIQKQMEEIEKKEIKQIYDVFLQQLDDANEQVKRIETALEEKRRHAIAAALDDGVDEKLAKKVRDLMGRLDANIANKNSGAARSCFDDLRSSELEMALIVHFKDEEKTRQYLRETETAIMLLPRHKGKKTMTRKERFSLSGR